MQTCKLKKRTGFAYTYGNLGIKTVGTWHIYSVHEPILMLYKERASEEALGNETQTQLEPDTLHFLLKAVCNLKLISESERMMRMNYMWVSPVSFCVDERASSRSLAYKTDNGTSAQSNVQHRCTGPLHTSNTCVLGRDTSTITRSSFDQSDNHFCKKQMMSSPFKKRRKFTAKN